MRPILRCALGLSSSLAAAVFVLFGCGGLQPRPADNWPSSCGDIKPVSGAKYCFYQTGPNPQYTIWFFHGAGDSEKVFQYSLFPQDSYIELEKGLPSVNIVTISYGPLWIMTAYDHRTLRPANATVEVFTSQIVPFIENEYYNKFKIPLVEPYVAIGHSQGGINVATLCAVLPHDDEGHTWSKCVLLNPMLPSCDPYDLDCPFWLPGLLIQANYSRPQWEQTQPLILLQNMNTKAKLPRSFVTACKIDQFDLFDGPQLWSNQANYAKPSSSSWYPVYTNCDHYHWPAQEVLTFLGAP
jgi:hypothetical protein